MCLLLKRQIDAGRACEYGSLTNNESNYHIKTAVTISTMNAMQGY